MKLKIKIPAKSINKAFQKDKVNRTDFENFKTQLQIIVNKIDDNESEEHLKNFLIQFFKNTFYQNNEVNTKGRTDLAIYSGISNKTTVRVIFETKKPSNKADMITKTDINKKALHEIILYYLQERIEFENNEIKNIIITNLNEWFIFDAIDFERAFFNTKLKQEYKKWKTGQKTSKNTNLFYTEIAKKYINQNKSEIECTYVDFQTFRNRDKLPENKLINLYKLFSPEYLLKLPHANDSNTLDTGFYNELLHIVGLEEIKINNKKVIKRKLKINRNPASFIENTINILRTEDRLKHIKNIEKQYGTKHEEQIINVALELNIMWINRILFLKLLEAQLLQYHSDNSDFKFLKPQNIADFDELNELFFEVLAKEHIKRNSNIKKKYKHIPYLNSSLFEISRLEDETIRINSLKSRLKLPSSKKSILSKGKELTILEYILNFLDAYDFTSEGSGKIQEENKNLINASVLGLIFEKINGYKDGSYFTPGYVTMYMSRENIRNAVVQKFKDAGYKDLTGFENLSGLIEDRKQANEVINSLKICDPAVGSGHFLVSALNEIIAIKSELGILEYQNGNRIKNYRIEVVNDELIISDKETEELFEYSLNKKGNAIDYKQDLQEAIFREKQTIIENCLFGVDINPNSVSICRLRLWVELLKNSYYTKESKYSELETLPNIDINIKQGNSLVGRFALNGNGIYNGQVQKMKLATEKYKTQVILYKSTNDKIVKQKAENEISRLKQQFAQNVNPTDKDYILLQQKKAKLGEMPMFFSESDKDEWKKETEQISNEVIELEKKYEEKLQTLYGNAFEWRFEFPEVLDENGNFIGFDIVIGNPPYGIKFTEYEKEYLKDIYYWDKSNNSASYFIGLATTLVKPTFNHSFIVPKRLSYSLNWRETRKFLLEYDIDLLIDTSEAFQNVELETMIYQVSEKKNVNNYKCGFVIDEKIIDGETDFKGITEDRFLLWIDSENQSIINKYLHNTQKLSQIATINWGGNVVKYSEKNKKHKFLKLYRGKNIKRYYVDNKNIGYIAPHNIDRKFYVKGEKLLIQRIFSRYGEKLIGNFRKARFVATYINDNHYVDKTVTMIWNSEYNLKYLLGIINSKLSSWFAHFYLYNRSQLTMEFMYRYAREFPVKIVSIKQQQIIADKVDKILKLKQKDINEDTSKLENEIDRLVYKLYNLNKEEIKIIENLTNRITII